MLYVTENVIPNPYFIIDLNLSLGLQCEDPRWGTGIFSTFFRFREK